MPTDSHPPSILLATKRAVVAQQHHRFLSLLHYLLATAFPIFAQKFRTVHFGHQPPPTMTLVVWILVWLIGILLCIRWRYSYSYWIRQKVPQLTVYPIMGSFFPSKKPLQELEIELYQKHGRVYGRYDGSTPVLSVAEPGLLKRILVKDFHLFSNRRDIKFNDPVVDNTLFSLEGEDWKRVRSIVSPTLTSAKLKRMLPLMEDCSEILIHNIQDTLKEKKWINVQRIFGAFVIDTIAKCAFGITINSLTIEDHPFVLKAKRLLECNFGWRTILIMICPFIMKILSIRLLNPDTTQFYKNIILEVMGEKKKSKGREDFLQLLMDNQATISVQDMNNNNVKDKCDEVIDKTDESSNLDLSSNIIRHTSGNHHTSSLATNHTASSSSNHNTSSTSSFIPSSASHNNNSSVSNHHNSSASNNTRVLSHDEIVAQCVTFFMAGYDATTSLLTHALYQLAMNQDYQDKVVEEIESALKDQKGELNYETLSQLKFMEAVLNECLRLCPSMVRNERRVEKDCMLGDTGIKLQKGMLISIPFYAIHRDPEWYPEPEEFRPERFYEPDPNRPQYVHLPFGAGPRICVGFRFVMMQVKLCLTKVLLRFRAEPCETTPAHLGFTEVRNILKVNEVEISLVDRKTSLTEDSWRLYDSLKMQF